MGDSEEDEVTWGTARRTKSRGGQREDEVTWGTAGGRSHVGDSKEDEVTWGTARRTKSRGGQREEEVTSWTEGPDPVDPQKPGGPLEMWRTLGDPEDPRDLVDPRRPSGQAMTWWTLGNSVKTLQHLVGPAKTRGQMKSQRTLRYPVDR